MGPTFHDETLDPLREFGFFPVRDGMAVEVGQASQEGQSGFGQRYGGAVAHRPKSIEREAPALAGATEVHQCGSSAECPFGIGPGPFIERCLAFQIGPFLVGIVGFRVVLEELLGFATPIFPEIGDETKPRKSVRRVGSPDLLHEGFGKRAAGCAAAPLPQSLGLGEVVFSDNGGRLPLVVEPSLKFPRQSGVSRQDGRFDVTGGMTVVLVGQSALRRIGGAHDDVVSDDPHLGVKAIEGPDMDAEPHEGFDFGRIARPAEQIADDTDSSWIPFPCDAGAFGRARAPVGNGRADVAGAAGNLANVPLNLGPREKTHRLLQVRLARVVW